MASLLASTEESSFAPSVGGETDGDDGLPDDLVGEGGLVGLVIFVDGDDGLPDDSVGEAGLVGLVIFVRKFMIPIPFRPFDFSLEAALGHFHSTGACLDTKSGGFSHVV